MDHEKRPYRPIPPGEILREELDARGWTQGDFAEITGKPIQAINEIITGKKAITPETALLLSEAIGTSPEFWLNLESAYRLDLLYQEQHKTELVSRKAKLYGVAPVKELKKRGWIQDTDSIDQLESEVTGFLGIPDLDTPPAITARFRTSTAGVIDTPALTAWLRKAQIDAGELSCASFDMRGLKQSIPRLISLSAEEETTRQVPERLCEVGVRVVFVPHLPQTRVDGAAFRLDNKSPVVALSLRLDRVDNFWFTLMHEIAHIVQGARGNKGYLDSDITQEPENDSEKKANRSARDWLIPPSVFQEFVRKTKPYFSRKAVITFAQEIGIHPAIVVGRLQYEGLIPYTNLRNLMGKVRGIFL